jgi:pyruvate formate lyase activating enzyme
MDTGREAMYYEAAGERIHCHLCPQDCRIAQGQRGVCRVRLNKDGRLWATNYSRCTARALDPTEKKPLYHFYPGSYLLSLGTFGCNLKCGFCQNWQISQRDAPSYRLLPEEAVQDAVQAREVNPRCVGLAYTYSEPLMWYEYVLETAALARQKGLKNVLVTNGFINREPLKGLLDLIDAANIDVKAFTEDFYRKHCKGRLEPVKETVEVVRGAGWHVEVTTLVIPGLNDDEKELADLARWLASIDKDIPLHLTRYFPNYRYSMPATPLDTLKRAWEVAREHLSYVYTGNMAGREGSTTLCPQCGHALICREGMHLGQRDLSHGAQCPQCGQTIAITGSIMS